MDPSPPAPSALHRGASLARALAWTILGVRLAYFDLLEVLRARSINDYGTFHAAAMAVRLGLDPYDHDQLQRAAQAARLPGVHPYFYPPLLAELLVPFTWWVPFAARLVWMALTVVSFGLSALLLDRWLGRRWPEDPALTDRARTALAVAVCALWPLRSTQMMAQVNALVLLLMVLWWTSRERWRWAGAWLGLAAAIKMSPALLVLVPLTERKWREALTAAGTGLALVAVSCALLGARGLRFAQDVLFGFLPGHRYHGLTVPIPLGGNHSLGALSFWLFDHGHGTDPHRLSPSAARFHALSVVALLGVWAARSLRGATAEGRAAALTVVMILAPTFAFEHHVAFAVLPIALLVALTAEGSLARRWWPPLVLALALLTEHEGSFMLPAGSFPGAVLALGHAGKLLPLLVLFAAGLAARRALPQGQR